jgi:hypothetical protein
VVYTEAHLKTLTPENIRMAFKKTGVIPVNQDVVTEQMMALSLESSSRTSLPIPQSSPLKVMSGTIVDYTDYQKLQAVNSDGNEQLPSSSATLYFVWTVVNSLSTTSGLFLTSSSCLKSTTVPPAYKPLTISPIKTTSRYAELLDRPVQSAREQELVGALWESEDCDNRRKQVMVRMQAGVVLAGMYTSRAQTQPPDNTTNRL